MGPTCLWFLTIVIKTEYEQDEIQVEFYKNNRSRLIRPELVSVKLVETQPDAQIDKLLLKIVPTGKVIYRPINFGIGTRDVK